MSLTLAEAKKRVDSIFAKYAAIAPSTSLIAPSLTAGKMYEAWILGLVLERLEMSEGYTVRLVGGSKVHLKSSAGPINRGYPRFELLKGGIPVFEAWTDIEFATLSYSMTHSSGKPGVAHRHELDVVVVPHGTTGYPEHREVVLALECKNTPFTKAMARAALGVRRELSVLRTLRPTPFLNWPASAVPAYPASVLMVYSTDASVLAYSAAGAAFGVQFHHEQM
jgi:hypothetical protein